MKIKRMLPVIAAAAVLAAVAGCSSGGSSGGGTSASGPVTINWWTWDPDQALAYGVHFFEGWVIAGCFGHAVSPRAGMLSGA
jgi:hypothetical protein